MLVVLGFPSNDFGHQEPGTEKEIKAFCKMTYGVDFPMFSKTRVAARNADPFYKKLAEASGTYPKWNFTSYQKTLLARFDRPLQLHISQHMILKPANVEMSTTTEHNG